MAFLDHNGESEFPLPKDKVFDAMCQAIQTVKGMKIEYADKLQGRIMVKAGVSLFSWGENIPIQLISVGEEKTKVQITSSPKTGMMLGGAFDMGKNRKNIEQILSATSRILSGGVNVNQPSAQYPTYMESQHFASSSAWYDKKWLVVLLCIIFPPVGLYALYKNNTITKGIKIAVAAVSVIIFIAMFSGNNKKNNSSSNDSAQAAAAPAMSQAEKDSIAEVEKNKAIAAQKENTISANDIVAAYTSNEVSADENFKGKSFYVVGHIESIGKDIMDDIYVTLESNDGIRSVQCYIDDKDVVKQLQKGQKLTVYGTCDGLMMNVLMKNCKVADNI